VSDETKDEPIDDSKPASLEQLLQAVVDEEKSLGRSAEGAKPWNELNRAIETDPAFPAFDEMIQVIGSGAAQFEKDDLAHWLVKRAAVVGARSAIDDVRRYLASEDFEFYRIMLLHGLRTQSECDLGNNIRLVPVWAIPNHVLKESILDPKRPYVPLPDVGSALVQSFRQQRQHSKEMGAFPFGSDFLLSRDLEHARLCFSLAGSFAPQSLGVCTLPPDDVPSKSGFGWTLGEFHGPMFPLPPIGREAIERAASIHARFVALSRTTQDHFRIALERLNEYESTRDLPRRAIAMRVALEALFLEGANSELKFRLGLHAAFFIGTNEDERREVFDCVKSAYDFGSKAVHTGRIDDKAAPKAFEVLNKVADIVRKSLVALINHPDADFEDRILRAGQD
jgi:hypothetical protein